MTENGTKQTRVMIWCVSRSLATCMLRAMVNRANTKGFMEPFSNAYYFGAERISSRFSSLEVLENTRFQDIKEQMEQPYEGFSTIVSKEIAFCVGHEKAEIKTRIPAGFKHTFIIRHPAKTLSNYYTMSTSPELTGSTYFEPKEGGFPELRYVYEVVTGELGLEAVVIDIDDLLEEPEAFLKLYCKKLGIPYEDSMLHWSPATENMSSLLSVWPSGWFTTLLKTNTFQKPKSNKLPDLTEFPEIVQKTVEDSMPHYEFLFAQRLRI